MAYNVMVSRLYNNSPVIQDYFNQTSSLAMSAYISNEVRVNLDTNTPYVGKEMRVASEVQFTTLLLPGDIPEQVLQTFNIKDTEIKNKIKNRFKDSESLEYGNHLMVKDPHFISKFWTMQDAYIKDISKGRDARIYNLMLFNSPAAKKHFPPEMNITVDDLREIEEKAIFQICHEFYLSKGLAVEIGRHQKEDIVHYHMMYPVRTFAYKYEQSTDALSFPNFRAWLSKSKVNPKRKSLVKREKNVKEWQTKFDLDPSVYNEKRLNAWKKKVIELDQELNDIEAITAGLLRSGYTYSKYYKLFCKNEERRIQKTINSGSVFATHKGHVENYLDTFSATDKIKERYAEILNHLLAEAGIIKPNTKLYEYSKSLREYITITESNMWGLSKEDRKAFNKIIRKPFNMDYTFFNKAFEEHKGDKEAYRYRKHLIVNALKVMIKESLQRHKRGFMNHPDRVQKWSNVWINQLEKIQEKYSEYIQTLIDRHIFNLNWRKVVNQNLIDEAIEQEPQIDLEEYSAPNVVNETYDFEDDEDEINEETLHELDIVPLSEEEQWKTFEREYAYILDQVYYENYFDGTIDVKLWAEWYPFKTKDFKALVEYAKSTDEDLTQTLFDFYEMNKEFENSKDDTEMELER